MLEQKKKWNRIEIWDLARGLIRGLDLKVEATSFPNLIRKTPRQKLWISILVWLACLSSGRGLIPLIHHFLSQISSIFFLLSNLFHFFSSLKSLPISHAFRPTKTNTKEHFTNQKLQSLFFFFFLFFYVCDYELHTLFFI